jgi:hypothetical protein
MRMLKNLSLAFAKILGFLVPTLVGVTFFFAILGVFGLGIAIAGLLVAVIGAVVLVLRVPAEGDAR